MDTKEEMLNAENKVTAEAAMVFLDNALEFQNLMVKYNCAIREVKTKLEVLNDDLRIKNGRTPIESISYRIKKPASILKKMQKKGYKLSVASIKDNLNDIAGIRVVCSFIDDIYSVAEMLTYQDDVTVLEVKDYIKNPKENGYRIDEMGILALYSRIDILQKEDHAVTVTEVKEIMDHAIEKAQRVNIKHFFKRLFGKHTDNADRIILTEQDFK